MAFLEQFSEQEKALLTALPYRAGLWISMADNDGGGAASAVEMLALSNIIEFRARGMFRSAFVHEVIAETYAHRLEWSKWGEGLGRVPAECRRAVEIMGPRLMTHDCDAYCQTVMAISRDVAKAFREFDENTGVRGRLMAGLRIKIDGIIGAIRGEEYESQSLLNISEKEDIALGTLATALRRDPAPQIAP